MKKILCGMFYRLFRGYELWAMLVLMFIISLLMNFTIIRSEDFNSALRSGHAVRIDYDHGKKNVSIDSSNVKQYRFESLGISAYDLYRSETEAIPDTTDKIINGDFNFAVKEMHLLFKALMSLYIMPSVLMVIFIPVFFGRMFSDGTLKNIIACGHSKGSIYLSSLLLTCMLDTVLLIMNLASVILWCAYFEWKPPVYLPAVLFYIVLMHMLVLTLSAISLSVLFACSKKTASFIAGFLIMVYILVPGASIAADLLVSNNSNIDTRKEDYIELRDIVTTNRMNSVDQRFSLSDFNIYYYYKGRKLDIYGEYGLLPGVRGTLLAIMYMDPGMIAHFGNIMSEYMMVRDGLVTINLVSCTFWTAISTGIGYLVFRKREIHC